MRIIIGCGKAKLNDGKAHQAQDMYVGSYFNINKEFALKFAPNNWWILSARYGLLAPTDIIEHYDSALKYADRDARMRWSEQVLAQMRRRGFDMNEETWFLAGKDYYEFVAKAFSNVQILTAEGMGAKMKKLKEAICKG